jgi:hypothetical protein
MSGVSDSSWPRTIHAGLFAVSAGDPRSNIALNAYAADLSATTPQRSQSWPGRALMRASARRLAGPAGTGTVVSPSIGKLLVDRTGLDDSRPGHPSRTLDDAGDVGPAAHPPRPRPGGHDGAGWSDSPAPTSSTLRRTSPSISMRLINPYSAAVSAPLVRNQVAPGAYHSSTSSNSARTRSLATPRILSSYARGRFVTSPALSCMALTPLSAVSGSRASPTDHPRQGELRDACPWGVQRPRWGVQRPRSPWGGEA